jgi:DNA polymerase III subunit epsilon
MNARTRFIIAVVVLGLLMTGPFFLTALVTWLNADPAERGLLIEVLGPHLIVGGFVTALGLVVGVAVVHRLFRQYVVGLLRMAENLDLMRNANQDFCIEEEGPPEVRALARSANALARQRDELTRGVEAQVDLAKRSVEQERNRLAALMAELHQSVVVCNLDGRILLYNSRARQQFYALSDAPLVAGGSELIGLGRSIYAVFDRNLISHALDTIQQRMRRRSGQAVAHFVTTGRAGQLLRVQMAPVLAGLPEESDGTGLGQAPLPAMTGFIMMLENITRDFENGSRRDLMLHSLTERNRAALANIRAAAEMLEYEDLEQPMRKRFRSVVRDEVMAMSERLDQAAAEYADALKARWPLEEMLGSDLIAAARRRIEARLGVATRLGAVDESAWVMVDSFSLLQALLYLVSRLARDLNVEQVAFRMAGENRLAQLDLVWSGEVLSAKAARSWECEPMNFAGESSPLTVREVIDRHGGEIWLERDESGAGAFFRILLPATEAPEQIDASHFMRGEGRPEYYDFDLFKTELSSELEDRLLSDLTYTVFDTETTGLNPSQGDEIIQIGATRIVNGKLLRQESFEQLVDPRRPMSMESIQIHGIQPEMLVNQPTIEKVLPAFHAFAADTVLVAHNGAFDMRFLEMKQKLTGLVFDQPVLDTLLLSAVLHPNQDSHQLEAIAERLNLTIVGRHTALGDAIVTAEVFIKMIPLLAEQGIYTLGEALRAAEKSYYARFKY